MTVKEMVSRVVEDYNLAVQVKLKWESNLNSCLDANSKQISREKVAEYRGLASGLNSSLIWFREIYGLSYTLDSNNFITSVSCRRNLD